ncbi:MAG: FKBP-type peptidyl-prolyl cis-trans isomerase [Bacteroidetes bacterium]|nr:FKBP-type peptidyl-prolyl cis-trans isomerase [Bacteroidota bacterium]
MRKLLLLLAIPFVFSSCFKDKETECIYTPASRVAPDEEIVTLRNWLDANGIVATLHPSGMFYTINSAGTGKTPEVCKTMVVKYVGSLQNGGIFDSNSTGITLLLGQLIDGWKYGLPLIKEGGTITLYIPPALGYGYSDYRDQNGSIRIPANSYLIFTIDLLEVN